MCTALKEAGIEEVMLYCVNDGGKRNWKRNED
jgi:hypothetical protein